MKQFAISGLTNRIYYGTAKELDNGVIKFTGKKEDVTDEVLKATFEWFLNQAVNKKKEIIIRFADIPFELVMRERTKSMNENKNKSKFIEECNSDCPCHKTVTHNACLFCNACRHSPYVKDDIDGKSDDEIEKMRREIEEEA